VSRPKPPARRDEFKVWHDLSTRWADNDAYGHVNNTVYYEWFDTAVNAWLIENGMLDIAAGDPIALVVETGCSYAKPLAFPQAMSKRASRWRRSARSSIRYRIGIFAKDSETAAAQGEFVHVVVDRQGAPAGCHSDEWRRKLEAIN
jgi:acyl-CoA thioester hydrolase